MSNKTTAEESVKIQRTRVLSWKYRVAPFATPWLILVGVYIASLITRLTCTGPVALIVLTLMGPALGIVTWVTWDRRHQHARNAAVAFVVGMGLWLALATSVGPFNKSILFMYVFLGSFLALTWNIRYAGITPTNKHDTVKGDKVNPLEAIKRLKGAVPTKVKEVADENGNGRVEVILQHPGGKSTTADVHAVKDNIAGAFSVDSSAVQVGTVRGRGDQTKLIVRPGVDPTTAVVPWPGVSMPGKSIMAGPLRTGMYEDSKPFAFWVTGDDEDSRVASATMYTGMTGSGKTRAYVLSMLEMTSRTDCAIPAVADPEKFLLSFGSVMDYIPIAADGPAQTDQFVSNVIEAMRYRARLLGSLGFEQWVPECWTRYGIPVQPVHIEEAGGYLANSPDFTKALMICRSMGLPISISLQVAVYRQLQREARSQFGNSLAFGVRELRDATFALTDNTLRTAGSQLTTWQNNEPGRFFAEVTGVPSTRWPLKVRAYKITRDEIVASFDANRDAGIAQCDPGTFDLLNRGIERPQRMIQLPGWGDVDVTPLTGSGDPVEADQRPTLQMIAGSAEPVDDDRPNPDRAQQMINERIDELEESGITELTKDDFDDLLPVLNRDRTWIFGELRRQVSQGRLTRQTGKAAKYSIIPRGQREEI